MNVVTPGVSAIESKGWWRAHQWLIMRRSSQITILFMFLLGPWFGLWIVKGNLSSSITLDVLSLTDPYLLLQSLVAGHLPESGALLGAVIVLGFYAFVGGRMFCSWVCPVNIVSDFASWLRRKLNIKGGAHFSRKTRYWILLMSLLLAAITQSIIWELVNPVSLMHRAIIFGVGAAWMIILAVFLFELILSRQGWCGHLCPVGAFYSLIGKFSLLRVSASRREQCNDCLDCFVVCPEEQVINPALKGASKGLGPVITDMNCTNCGRCIDVCGQQVFEFSTRFHHSVNTNISNNKEVTP